jgi:hypothetical protein
MKQLILASGQTPTRDEQRLSRFATWMGIQVETLAFDDDVTPIQHLGTDDGASEYFLAISAARLGSLGGGDRLVRLQSFIEQRCAGLLVFDCNDSSRHDTLLSWLTDGAVRGVNRSEPRDNTFQVSPSGVEFSRQLAGLSFSTGRIVSVPTMDLAVNHAVDVIMLANDHPTLVRGMRASCQIFLLASMELPDIDKPLSRDTGVEVYYDQVIPLLVFLRNCFGTSCWHGPESTARIVIDDPLLVNRYGFLDFIALLSSMRRGGYGTSIAFIPWNYRRTSRRTVSTLFGSDANLSICVHGCDHTNKEFDTSDQAALQHLAGLALRRMERHEKRAGVPFERVMVFPQGRFSSGALLALRATNYLAAVNSTCFPTDDGSQPLKMAELLRPAVTRFHGFPVFPRRYPRHTIDSAFDMFLGRPALLVEHHGYFRDGCGALEEFVKVLHTFEPTLSWPTLSSQLMRSCMMRCVSDSASEVQFFTRRFRLENNGTRRRQFLLAKHEPDRSAVRAVLVDGVKVAFSFKGDLVQLELEADPGQPRNIEILDHPTPPSPGASFGVTHSAGVLVRRRLSEFRDNALARHPRLLNAGTRLARRLRVTGDS